MSQKCRTAEATLYLDSAFTMGRIMALMELAAVRLVQQGLRGPQSSVGIAMDVTHAAQALGAGNIRRTTVRAVATLREVDGRLQRIAVDAFDETGLIARAEHTRAVVDGRVGRRAPELPLGACVSAEGEGVHAERGK